MSPQPPKDILLVEDNPDDAELTTIGLERHNLANRLVVASDGAEALELLIGEHATPFAFVMLDLKLPKVSGQQVLQRVRADPRAADAAGDRADLLQPAGRHHRQLPQRRQQLHPQARRLRRIRQRRRPTRALLGDPERTPAPNRGPRLVQSAVIVPKPTCSGSHSPVKPCSDGWRAVKRCALCVAPR